MLTTNNNLDLEASYAMMQQDNEIIFGEITVQVSNPYLVVHCFPLLGDPLGISERGLLPLVWLFHGHR